MDGLTIRRDDQTREIVWSLGSARCWMRERQAGWYITLLLNPSGNGLGIALLREVCRQADLRGVTVSLSPAEENYEVLARYYQHFGFQEVGMGFMVRPPRREA